jgi:hypothetical protein
MKSFKINFISCISVILIASCYFTGCNSQLEEEKVPVAETGKSASREKPKLVHDAKGNIIERHAHNYRSDNTVRSIEDYYYKYDDRNNLIEETKESSNPQGELVYKNINIYIYNDLNQKVEQKFFSYDKNNQLQQQARNTYRYSNKGQLLEEKAYHANGELKSIVSTERTGDGTLKSEEYLNFNDKGQKISHKKYHYTKYGLDRTEDLMIK